MTDFEQQVVERLTRLETHIASLREDLRGFKAKVVTVAAAIGAFVSGVFSFFAR